MKLESIASLLQTASLGVMGESIFINAMPAAPVKGILLIDPFGGTPIDHELPGYRRGSFVMVVRSRDYQEAETLINAAIVALTIQDQALPGMTVKTMRARHDPFPFPVSPGNYVEFTVNIDCRYVIV